SIAPFSTGSTVTGTAGSASPPAASAFVSAFLPQAAPLRMMATSTAASNTSLSERLSNIPLLSNMTSHNCRYEISDPSLKSACQGLKIRECQPIPRQAVDVRTARLQQRGLCIHQFQNGGLAGLIPQ